MFYSFNLKPVTQCQFSSKLCKALKFLNIQTLNYKTHIFRILCATHLYLQGLSEAEIQQMGRWKSTAYKSYIRHLNV